MTVLRREKEREGADGGHWGTKPRGCGRKAAMEEKGNEGEVDEEDEDEYEEDEEKENKELE